MVKYALMKPLNIRAGRHRILHVGGGASDARKIREMLTESTAGLYDVEWVRTLFNGFQRLTANPMSAVLVDRQLPDCPVIYGVRELIRAASGTPVLVVGADEGAGENERIARQIVEAGAHDYLLTNRLDSYWLPRALRDAIERKLSEEVLFAEAERVEVTLDSLGDALLSTDSAGRVTYLNRIAESMTGWSRGEAAGRPLEEVLQIVDGATREPAEDLMEGTIPGNQTSGVV